MKIKVWMAMAALLVCSTVAFAQEQKPMSPEEKAAMDSWMKYMTPGDGHKAMDHMIGKFDAKVTMWMAPGAPPQVSTGVGENQWILGNRYVDQKYDGTMMGMPFSGKGLMGYDNAKKQYFGTWVDNMGTGMMNSTGNTTDGGKTWTFNYTSVDPMTGKDMSGTEKVTVSDNDHHTMEMWGPGPDGKVFKMMEINYTRKK